MKYIPLLLFLFSCASTDYRTDDEIKLYAAGFAHGCSYQESKKDFNLSGIADCANKEKQLVDYYRKTGMKK